MIISIAEWKRQVSANYDLKNKIITDKLSHGVDGVEWLVMHYQPSCVRATGLTEWIEYLAEDGFTDYECVMLDALTLKSEVYFKRYDYGWPMSVGYALHYLYTLKEKSYDQYFRFIMKIKRRQELNMKLSETRKEQYLNKLQSKINELMQTLKNEDEEVLQGLAEDATLLLTSYTCLDESGKKYKVVLDTYTATNKANKSVVLKTKKYGAAVAVYYNLLQMLNNKPCNYDIRGN